MKFPKLIRSRTTESQASTIIKPNVILFQTIIFKDEMPVYYEVMHDGIKYIWEPDKKNRLDNLPSFTIWREENEWRVETRDMRLIDKDMIVQAAADLKSYC